MKQLRLHFIFFKIATIFSSRSSYFSLVVVIGEYLLLLNHNFCLHLIHLHKVRDLIGILEYGVLHGFSQYGGGGGIFGRLKLIAATNKVLNCRVFFEKLF
jgi:hypothetical protein